MDMLKNCKESCGSKSRHIHIRYFFTKDVLNRENMEEQHGHTKQMIADFYTKPLLGEHYYKLRNIIMEHDTLPVEEGVEMSDNLAADISTKRAVRTKMSTKYGFKVSNNFN